LKTARRIGKVRRRNKELNVKSSSARLHTKEAAGSREEQREIRETEAASKNIFFHHRPNDDPVQTITKMQKKWRPDSFIN